MELKGLQTKYLGRNIIHYKTIDSTQSEIWRLIESNNIKNGTIVIADIQTNGQGTHGRKWYTDQANNIAFSLAIELNCNIKKLDGLTIKIAELIVKIMQEMYSIKLDIKEPNDLYSHGKKVGGILTQTKLVGEKVTYLVIGIGINTSQKEFAEEVKNIATSIKNESNADVNIEEFLSEFCNEFEKGTLGTVLNGTNCPQWYKKDQRASITIKMITK